MSLKEIIAACAPARVLAVSKLQPVEKVTSLYLEGQRHFGENYVQEALEKMKALQDLSEIEWHLIGNLQKKKAKIVAGKFNLIHSIDSLELATKLSEHCGSSGLTQNILIQVNIANQESKHGFDKNQVMAQWNQLTALPAIKIMGLMTMPPLTESGEHVRPYFRELRLLLENLRLQTDLKRHPLTELSMGTSHDFTVAIEEGATIVRLGTILFGERPPKM
jgi:pyridoxal phosphate enzyme (YggS family)